MSTEHKIVLNYSYSDETSAKKALDAAIKHLETAGLEMRRNPLDFTILDGETELRHVSLSVLGDYYTIAKLHALAEKKEVENYLNANLPRFAALGWQVEINESRVTPMLDATRTAIRVVIIDGRIKDYSISLEGVYQLDRDLERAELRARLIRAMPKFRKAGITVILNDDNVKWRDMNGVSYTCPYVSTSVAVLLKEIHEDIASQTCDQLSAQM